jgi:hypothetical protein
MWTIRIFFLYELCFFIGQTLKTGKSANKIEKKKIQIVDPKSPKAKIPRKKIMTLNPKSKSNGKSLGQNLLETNGGSKQSERTQKERYAWRVGNVSLGAQTGGRGKGSAGLWGDFLYCQSLVPAAALPLGLLPPLLAAHTQVTQATAKAAMVIPMTQ